MRGGPFVIAAVGRAARFILVAAAMIATAVHFRHDGPSRPAPVGSPSTPADPLAGDLARCQAIGFAAKDDAGCEAAWAEKRRRFFTYRPAEAVSGAPATGQKPVAKPGGR